MSEDIKIPRSRAYDVFSRMLEGRSVDEAVQELGIKQVDDSSLVALCQKLVVANPKIVADVQGGKVQAIGALIGQAKKENPNIDPTQVQEICLDLVKVSF